MPATPRIRLLVVDDDEVLRELLPLLVDATAFDVLTAASGDEAVALLRATSAPIGVVLTDLHMPGLTGLALAAAIRAAAPLARQVGMSGAPPPESVRTTYDAFLCKPFAPVELHDVLQAVLAAKPARTVQIVGKTQAAAAVSGLDDAIFKRFAASMPRTGVQQLYDLFLTDAYKRVAAIKCAADVADEVTVRREAHALRGSSGMLGATRLQALAALVETGTPESTPGMKDLELALDELGRMLAVRFPCTS